MATTAVYGTVLTGLILMQYSALAQDINLNGLDMGNSLSQDEIIHQGTYAIETDLIRDLDEQSERLDVDISRYKQSIADQEAQNGVYHPQVKEQLMSLGILLQNNGLHEDAVDLFTRALHITRVNNGLESLDQLPILESLIESDGAISNWEGLDQHYNYMYWLHKRAYGVNATELLPVINRVASWNIDAYSKGISQRPYRHLLTAELMYEDAIHIIEHEYGENDSRLINYLYGLSLANFEKAMHINNVSDFDEVILSSRTVNSLRNSHATAQRLIDRQNQIVFMTNMSYAIGKNAMVRILDIFQNNPSLAPDAHAMAHLHLGDWYLMFNRKNTALESYEHAYAMMNEIDVVSRERIFNRPRSLPALRFALHKDRPKPVDEKYVVASFDVTKTGKTRNIEILEVYPPDHPLLLKRAKNTLKSARFRPRFVDGEAVSSTGVNIRYVFEE